MPISQQQLNYIASSPKHQQQQQQQQQGHHHPNLTSPVNYMNNFNAPGNGATTPGLSSAPLIAQQVSNNNNNGGSDSGSSSNLSYPPSFINYSNVNSTNTTNATMNSFMTLKLAKSVQTEITTSQMMDSASAIETKNTQIDELIKEKEEMSRELIQLKKDHEKQTVNFKKCLNFNKKLLMEKVHFHLNISHCN